MTGFIYVIASSSGLYKIGHSNDPLRRLTMLRTSTADELTLLGVVEGTVNQERQLHKLLRGARVAREWFRPCKAMQPLIDGLRPIHAPTRQRPPREDDAWRSRLGSLIDQDARSMKRISLDAGLGQNFVSQLLTSRDNPTVDTLLKLARTLGVPVTALLEDAA